MFDMEKIMSLTVDEVLIINGLLSVAKEAKEHAKLIADTYHCFGIGEDKIEIWSDSHNEEYLTHDGIWQARYLHQEYDVSVNENTIFNFYRSEWLVENGYAKEYENDRITVDGERAKICRYFRAFVNKTEAAAQK